MKKESILKILGILIILVLIICINTKSEVNEYYFMTKLESNNLYYDQSLDLLSKLSLEEKIKELIIARYNDETINENYGGYIFFEDNFKGKNKNEVVSMINKIQKNKKIKCLTAVDEEGGTVVRISNNRKLSNYTYKSSQELYKIGGFNEIVNDVYAKSKLLEELGFECFDGRGYTVKEIAEDFYDKKLLLRLDGHLTCAMYGDIYDIWNTSYELVDIFWIIE